MTLTEKREKSLYGKILCFCHTIVEDLMLLCYDLKVRNKKYGTNIIDRILKDRTKRVKPQYRKHRKLNIEGHKKITSRSKN